MVYAILISADKPMTCCFSGPPGTRTPNLWIKSPQLCQLS
jgi:hypothetical protein